MINEALFEVYSRQFDNLLSVVQESNRRVIQAEADPLFTEHLNVFVKAYFVSACSILEAHVQDLACGFLRVLRERTLASNIPRNLVLWATPGDTKAADMKFEVFDIKIERKDVTDAISGNVYKTIKVFERLGIEVSTDAEFASYKDTIGSKVDKRNLIVHHNDSASDLSLTDVANTIVEFKQYLGVLTRVVCGSPSLRT